MICRRCLKLSSTLGRQAARSTSRSFSATVRPLAAAAAAPSADTTSQTPEFSKPLGDGASAAGEAKPALSSCPEGTILAGLNYFKNKTDPVALADEAYPEWLWRCLEVQEKQGDDAADDAADEYSKSKKQRRQAAKKQRLLEAKLLAEGNIEALAPKIPLQQQSINLPGNEEGTTEGALAAVDAREDLRRAMRRERKAKIKEANYLKTL